MLLSEVQPFFHQGKKEREIHKIFIKFANT